MEKKNRQRIVIILAAVVTVVVIGIVFLLLNREESYRVIKIFSLDGNAIITRVKLGEIEAYENMLLESGDVVALNTGTMTLKLDEDKYVYVEEQTEFALEASGSSENGKTRIRLNRGAITNELQNKLNGESAYEINTPNSTMSVRGTIYRVEVYIDEQGVLYTKVSVFEGSVAVRLIYPDGTVSDDETIIDKGKEVIVYEDGSTTDYLTDVRDIDYTELPDSVIELLIQLGLDADEPKVDEPDTSDLEASTQEEIDTEEDLSETFTVTFLYEGSIFGKQQVKKGDCVTEPVLMPTSGGSWDFDFSMPITEDTKINWKLP